MVAYGTEKPQAYRPRLVDERLQRLLSTFGAVEIRGTKWCGKSWAALAFGESVVHLDDPNVKALAEADPALALQGARPHVVDEWQEVPSTWDATRRAVDAAGGERGLFILTGSSTPAKDAVTHSGAGRIARVDMSTMTLWERGLSTGSVSLGCSRARSIRRHAKRRWRLWPMPYAAVAGPPSSGPMPRRPQRSSTSTSMPCSRSAFPRRAERPIWRGAS